MDFTRQMHLLTVIGLMLAVCAGHPLFKPDPTTTIQSIDEILRKADNISSGISWDKENHRVLTEYDIVMSEEEWLEENIPNRLKRAAPLSKDFKWTNNVVYYEISGDFASNERGVIMEAIRDFEYYTCMKFYESTTATNRVNFASSMRCFSYIGMRGGVQEIGLSPNCVYKSVIAHEIAHALGIHHTQTRPDRDQFITIRHENIKDGWEKNFKLHQWHEVLDFGIPYEYESLMHYSKNAFAKSGADITMEPKDPRYLDIIGHALEMTFNDIKTVNLMYGCGKIRSPWGENLCPGDGFLGPNGYCWCQGDVTPVEYCNPQDQLTLGQFGRPAIPDCKDHMSTSRCVSWAGSGYCDKDYVDFMRRECKTTCGYCG